jgi:hypothetical protein
VRLKEYEDYSFLTRINATGLDAIAQSPLITYQNGSHVLSQLDFNSLD